MRISIPPPGALGALIAADTAKILAEPYWQSLANSRFGTALRNQPRGTRLTLAGALLLANAVLKWNLGSRNRPLSIFLNETLGDITPELIARMLKTPGKEVAHG